MDIADYLLGGSASAVVRDLIGRHNHDVVDVLFLVESPHTAELDVQHPLAGTTGRDALAILQSRRRDAMSLGAMVKRNIDAGDGRLAIVNISTVPLQKDAFERSQRVPAPPPIDWMPLVELREHAQNPTLPWSKEAEEAHKVLLADVRRRIQAVKFGPGSLVAVCGNFAAMFAIPWPLPPHSVLRLPHPSFGHWRRVRPNTLMATNVDAVRQRFVQVISSSTP